MLKGLLGGFYFEGHDAITSLRVARVEFTSCLLFSNEPAMLTVYWS